MEANFWNLFITQTHEITKSADYPCLLFSSALLTEFSNCSCWEELLFVNEIKIFKHLHTLFWANHRYKISLTLIHLKIKNKINDTTVWSFPVRLARRIHLVQNLPLTLVVLVVKWFAGMPCKQNWWVALSYKTEIENSQTFSIYIKRYKL